MSVILVIHRWSPFDAFLVEVIVLFVSDRAMYFQMQLCPHAAGGVSSWSGFSWLGTTSSSYASCHFPGWVSGFLGWKSECAQKSDKLTRFENIEIFVPNAGNFVGASEFSLVEKVVRFKFSSNHQKAQQCKTKSMTKQLAILDGKLHWMASLVVFSKRVWTKIA